MSVGETRVNLKHLLEDIRDSYPIPLEEAIITELAANALDSGASRIQFVPDYEAKTLTVIDDGRGMEREELVEFHDIAATTKVKGKGIGFAGVGVKLALLISDEVVTETRASQHHGATKWHLKDRHHAPWESIPSPGLLQRGTGTAVTMKLWEPSSYLLRPEFIRDTIVTHFYPLLDEEFMDKVLRYIYKRGVRFVIGEDEVSLSHESTEGRRESFGVFRGPRRKPIGIGFLVKHTTELDESQRGVAVSTFGKVIKRGWDWLGILPRNPNYVTGVVEVPALAEILTTSKTDFLKDASSLQKYYACRKSIQSAIEPALRALGEAPAPREKPDADLEPLRKQIERVVGNMLNDFPELAPLLEKRRAPEPTRGVLPDPEAEPIGTSAEGVETMTGTEGGRGEGGRVEAAPGMQPGERIEPTPEGTEPGRVHEGRLRRPTLMVGYADEPSRGEMGWLEDSTIWINRSHPAYVRAKDPDTETYHAVLTVAWVLSGYLEAEKSPRDFMNQFLSVWGAAR